MVKEIQYTSIKRVLDELTEHPMLRDLTLEQVIRHTIRFISIHGYPKLYEDKIEDVEIHDFRGLLPCDLVSIIQVKERHTGLCLRSMTDTFVHGLEPKPSHPHKHPDLMNNVRPHDYYLSPEKGMSEELSFKTQGRIIFTSFPEGIVEVAYKAIPVDENGYPMLIDNENYLAALEAYIKKMVFTVKFDTGEIASNVLQNAKADYAWLAGQLNAEFVLPSVSEMESITRAINTLIPRMREFDHGFQSLGNREWLRKH